LSRRSLGEGGHRTPAPGYRIPVLLFPVLIVLALSAWQLPRDGYSTDEEFTLFAVRGIETTGLPLLPSSLLYDRGLAYSYLAWLGGTFSTPSLVAYRAVAWAAAIAELATVFSVVRAVASPRAALLASALVAVSLPFVAVATTARFYAPFLFLYLLTLRLLSRYAIGDSRGGAGWRAPVGVPPFHHTDVRRGSAGLSADGPEWLVRPSPLAIAGLFTSSFLARGTHELAFTLAAVPITAMLLCPRGQRRTWAALSVAVFAGVVTAQLALVGLHQLPSAEAPAESVAAVPGATGLAPRYGRAETATAAPLTTPSTPPSMLTRFFVWQVVNLIEWPLDPLDFFAHIAREMPGLVIGVLGLLVLRFLGNGAPWTGPQRVAHLLWAGWMLFFGVIDSGITINYLLVPVTLMLTALAIDVTALVPKQHFGIVAALLVAVMSMEQWGSPAQAAARLDQARPTMTAAGESLRELAARAERVACTDELACLLLAGRVDRWLALDDFLRTRFIVTRGGQEVGVYGGRPVARTLPDLFASADHESMPATVLVIDVFKDLPVGPSARFLDRALAETPFHTRLVWASPRMRAIEIHRTPGP
jgi:hypothetical protein